MVQITEGTENCAPPNCPVYVDYLTKFPNAWGQVAFWANPANLPYQGNTTLFWSGPQGAIYKIEYIADGSVINIPKPGDPPLASHGQYPGVTHPPLTLDATTAFTLNVSQRIDNHEYTAQQQVIVSVAAPPPPKPKINKFNGVVAIDGSQLQLTLSWDTEKADQVSITNVNGIQKDVDTLVIQPANNRLANSYTLEARKGVNSVKSTITILWAPYKNARVWGTPWDCGILPNGSRLFALSGGVTDEIVTMDPLTLERIGAPFKIFAPFAIAAPPDSSRIYVRASVDKQAKLYGFEPGNFKNIPGSPADAQPMAWRIAVSPDGKRVYVAGSGEVRVYDTSNLKQLASIPVGDSPMGIAFTPDSSRAFVAVTRANKVSVIDTAQLKEIATFPVGQYPNDVAVTRDGKQLYVGNNGAQSVQVFDPATYKELSGSPIAVHSGPSRLRFSPDGKLLFVLCKGGYERLTLIDTATREVVGYTSISDANGIAVSPDGVRVYIQQQVSTAMWMLLPAATGGIG
jgi:YVTN family beta-propeller protein